MYKIRKRKGWRVLTQWKDVDGYEGLYKVSTLGVIKGTKELSAADNGKGYKYVFLSKNGVETRFYVHRIVAKAFIPNPGFKPFVNHINGIRGDNRVENLEWVTASENELHKYAKLGFVQKKAKPVIQIKNQKIVGTYISIHAASKATRCGTKEISLCCRGKKTQTGGFQWKYAKTQE